VVDTKTIELSNPSKKKVGYLISTDGSPEFSISTNEVILPPESILDFPIGTNICVHS
jgi:hypothetical protein